jgi:hypothetical protein
MTVKKKGLVEKIDLSELLYHYDRLKLRISRSRIYELNLDPYEDELEDIIKYIKDIRTHNDIIDYKTKRMNEGKSIENINTFEDLIDEYYIIAEKVNNEIENTIKTQPKPFFIPLSSYTFSEHLNISTLDDIKKELSKIEEEKTNGASESILNQKSSFLFFLIPKIDEGELEDKKIKKKALKLINKHRLNLGFSVKNSILKDKEKKLAS